MALVELLKTLARVQGIILNEGEARLLRLAALHRRELRSLKEVFQVAHISAFTEQWQ